jgi:hypothetical protein
MNLIEHNMLNQARNELDAAIDAIEGVDVRPALLGAAVEHLLHVRGILAALHQMGELQAIERAPTERPSHLRLVLP